MRRERNAERTPVRTLMLGFLISLGVATASAETVADDPQTAAQAAKLAYPIAENVSVEGGRMVLFVRDNGLKRDGAASALCQSLARYPDAPWVVHIYDSLAADQGETKSLGRAFCR